MRRAIAQLLLLLMQGGASVPTLSYLWRAIFDDIDGAPMTTPRAETIGESVIVQPDNILSTDGIDFISNGTSNGSNMLTASAFGANRAFTFQAGRTFQFNLKSWSGTYGGRLRFARTATPPAQASGVVFISSTSCQFSEENNQSVSGIVVLNPIRDYAVCLRENGGVFLFDVTNEKLLWVSDDRTSGSRYAAYESVVGTTPNFKLSEMSVYDVPTGSPLTTEYGIAVSRIATPSSGQSSTMTADSLLEVDWTVQTNEVLTWLFRRTDNDNTLKIVCDQAGGTIKLFARSAGADTELDAGKLQTWTNGSAYRITVELDGSSIVTRVEGVPKNRATSAAQQSANGLIAPTSTLSINISNLVCWPRSVPGFPLV